MSLSIPVFGQSAETEKFYAVELSRQTKEQVVKRILTNYFKPTDKPKVVYIAEEGIEGKWMPSIVNIEFRLISRNEVEQRKISVYLFSDIWQNNLGSYQIVFGYGDPNCKYSGGLWKFRLSNTKVRLWRGRNVPIGGNCSHPSQ